MTADSHGPRFAPGSGEPDLEDACAAVVRDLPEPLRILLLEQLWQVHIRPFADLPPGRSAITAVWNDKVHLLLHWDDDGQLDGVVQGHPGTGAAQGMVRPSRRRRGIGSALFAELLRRGYDERAHALRTEDGAAFVTAFYRRQDPNAPVIEPNCWPIPR